MPNIDFFATRNDLLPVLRAVEDEHSVCTSPVILTHLSR